MAVDCLGVQSVDHLNRIFKLSSRDFNVSSIALKRTGHARFRRAPSLSSSGDINGPSISTQSEEKQQKQHALSSFSSGDINGPSTSSQTEEKQQKQNAPSSSPSTSSSSIVSSLAGGNGFEETVSNGKSLGIVAPTPMFSSRKPPLPSTHRKRCSVDRPAVSVLRSGSGCHCCKKRKIGLKRQIRKVPIIGPKITSIPADDYSWKKYGEKKIDGSRYPRVYYKCSTGKGCPARKRVELAVEDSKILVVTYDGEHRHCHALTPVPMSFTGVRV